MGLDMTLVAGGFALMLLGLAGMTVRARGRVSTRDLWLGPAWGSKLARLRGFVALYRRRIGTDAWVWLLGLGLALFASGILLSLAFGRSSS